MPKSVHKKKTRKKQIARKDINASSKGLNILTSFVFYCFLGAIALGAAVLSLPEYKRLESLQDSLNHTLSQEDAVIAQKDAVQRELYGLRNDSAYLELMARDRLDLYREGETIFRISENARGIPTNNFE